MRELEKRIEKLEQQENTHDELIEELHICMKQAGLSILEQVRILGKLGLVKGELIGQLIREGAEKSKKNGGTK